jgi:hypothetical protein
MLISNSLKMFLKIRHTFANNFLLVHFLTTFSTIWKSCTLKFCVFYTFLIYFKNFC